MVISKKKKKAGVGGRQSGRGKKKRTGRPDIL
jgi:hypothetical protein